MIDQSWIYGIPSRKQARYQTVTYCNDWTFMGSNNIWNIIELTPKSTALTIHQPLPIAWSFDFLAVFLYYSNSIHLAVLGLLRQFNEGGTLLSRDFLCL